jgi:hypothetical protein
MEALKKATTLLPEKKNAGARTVALSHVRITNTGSF